MLASFARVAAIATLTLSSFTASAQVPTVRVQDWPGIAGTLVRVAAEKGYCAKYGIQCTLQNIPSGTLGLQALLAGGINVAYPALEPAIQSASKGAELKIIGGGFDNNPFMLIVGPDLFGSSAKGYPAIMQDLKGKKIGVTMRGSGGEFQFKALLAGAGMKPDDVIFVATGAPNTQYAALVNKQTDAAMSFMPIDGFCDVLKTCKVVLDPARGQGPKVITDMNGVGAVYVVRREFAQKNSAQVEAFNKAMKDAEKFVSDPANASEVAKITDKYYRAEMPNGQEAIASSLARYRPHMVYEVKKQGAQAVADFLFETGQLEKKFDISRLF